MQDVGPKMKQPMLPSAIALCLVQASVAVAVPEARHVVTRIATGQRQSATGQGKTRFRGLAWVRFAFTLTIAAYNLVRLPKLLETG